MDANSITTRRTAATSALAASFLAKPQSTSLLMIGTGALAPQLIAAHAAVNPLQKVFLWGRNFEKASRLAFQLMAEMEIDIQPIKEIDAFIHEADIISTATLSPDPLIDGKLLVPGQHLDLVGSYRRDMRESDDECILKSDLFVDVMPNPLKESGDFAIPLAEGLITKDDIKGDLIDLCKTSINGRMSFEQITLFKSVGYALEDLVAAQLIMERID
jgi:ornithine cyclodeaminase